MWYGWKPHRQQSGLARWGIRLHARPPVSCGVRAWAADLPSGSYFHHLSEIECHQRVNNNIALHLKRGTSPINLDVAMSLFLLLLKARALIFNNNNNLHLFSHTCQVLCQMLYMMIARVAKIFEVLVWYTECQVFYLYYFI